MQIKDKDGNVIGEVGGESNSTPLNRVEGASGDITGAPFNGDVGPSTPVSGEERPVGTFDLAINQATGRDSSLEEAQREANETLTADMPGRLSETNKNIKDKIAEKLENKSAEGTKSDLSHGEMGVSPQRLDPSRTIQREDGTFTTADRPDETAHMIHGARVMLTDEDFQKYKELTEAVSEAQGKQGVSDIPLSDPYWERKRELDAFVSKMKR